MGKKIELVNCFLCPHAKVKHGDSTEPVWVMSCEFACSRTIHYFPSIPSFCPLENAVQQSEKE